MHALLISWWLTALCSPLAGEIDPDRLALYQNWLLQEQLVLISPAYRAVEYSSLRKLRKNLARVGDYGTVWVNGRWQSIHLSLFTAAQGGLHKFFFFWLWDVPVKMRISYRKHPWHYNIFSTYHPRSRPFVWGLLPLLSDAKTRPSSVMFMSLFSGDVVTLYCSHLQCNDVHLHIYVTFSVAWHSFMPTRAFHLHVQSHCL